MFRHDMMNSSVTWHIARGSKSHTNKQNTRTKKSLDLWQTSITICAIFENKIEIRLKRHLSLILCDFILYISDPRPVSFNLQWGKCHCSNWFCYQSKNCSQTIEAIFFHNSSNLHTLQGRWVVYNKWAKQYGKVCG